MFVQVHSCENSLIRVFKGQPIEKILRLIVIDYLMPTIDLDKYLKITQMHPGGCIPVNIENALKYFNEFNYCEIKLLMFFESRGIPPGFKEFVPKFAPLLPNFEFIFKGIDEFDNSIEKVIEYLKSNIDKKIPVLVSFKQIVDVPLFEKNKPNPVCFIKKELAHIRTLIGYNEEELCFFDPGDCKIKQYNYLTDDFANSIKGDYHTLMIKRKE